MTSQTASSYHSSSNTLAPPSSVTSSNFTGTSIMNPSSSTSTAPTILDRPISRGTTTCSLSAFSYLFAELISYHQKRIDSIHELEASLHKTGYGIGLKVLELLTYRTSIQNYLLTSSSSSSSSSSQPLSTPSSSHHHHTITLSNVIHLNGRKEKNLITMLQYLHSTIWKSLFNRVADGLEKATDKEDEYYIYDREPLTNRFISIPKEMGHFNCATFIAGVIQGILTGSQFPSEVSAHFNTTTQGTIRTVYVMKFEKEVTKREG